MCSRGPPGEVLFDRICREKGSKHILTAPRSPTTTGKVERWHKTLRREFLNGRVFASLDDAQAQLDGWVWTYNHDRPHQSIGMVAPGERFRLATTGSLDAAVVVTDPEAPMAPSATRRVGRNGLISFAAVTYRDKSVREANGAGVLDGVSSSDPERRGDTAR